MATTFMLVLLILLAILSAPAWPYSRDWGYRPSGTFATLVALLVLFWLLGVVAFWFPGARPAS